MPRTQHCSTRDPLADGTARSSLFGARFPGRLWEVSGGRVWPWCLPSERESWGLPFAGLWSGHPGPGGLKVSLSGGLGVDAQPLRLRTALHCFLPVVGTRLARLVPPQCWEGSLAARSRGWALREGCWTPGWRPSGASLLMQEPAGREGFPWRPPQPLHTQGGAKPRSKCARLSFPTSVCTSSSSQCGVEQEPGVSDSSRILRATQTFQRCLEQGSRSVI